MPMENSRGLLSQTNEPIIKHTRSFPFKPKECSSCLILWDQRTEPFYFMYTISAFYPFICSEIQWTTESAMETLTMQILCSFHFIWTFQHLTLSVRAHTCWHPCISSGAQINDNVLINPTRTKLGKHPQHSYLIVTSSPTHFQHWNSVFCRQTHFLLLSLPSSCPLSQCKILE